MTKQLEFEIASFLIERNWHKPLPADVAKSICIEAAELLEVFQWNAASIAKVKRDKKMLERIKQELADVFIYGLVMAVSLGLETTSMIQKKLAQVKKKYPAELMRGSAPASNNAYYRIKQGYRRK